MNPTIFGIGTDIIEIDRFLKDGKPLGQRFMERVFTANEQAHLKNRHIENMAGLFAAKEAVAKVLGTGFVGFKPSAIEIIHNERGKPTVVLHDGAKKIAEEAGVTGIEVSISHCKSLAVGMAVAY